MRSLSRVVVAVLATAMVQIPGTARAADPGTPSYSDLPAGWSFAWLPHATPEYGPYGTYEHVDGDAPPGVGTGSLRLVMGPSAEDRLTLSRSLAGLTAASVWIRSADVPEQSVPPATEYFFVNVDTVTYVGMLPILSTWTQVDLGQLPLSPETDATVHTTLVDLAAAHPTAATLTLAVINGYDAGGTRMYVDGWSTTTDGVTDAVDFEGPHTPVLCLMQPTSATIVAGGKARLTGFFVLEDLSPLSGLTVSLAAQRWDQMLASAAGSGTTGTDGHVALTVKPQVATTYVMSHVQDATYGRCAAGPVLVKVRTRVSIAAAARVAHGQQIVATGRTTPAKPGTAVILWRSRPGADAKLATGKVASNGKHYRLATNATTNGGWKVYVTVAAGTGNLSGTSAVTTVQVS